MNGLFTVGAVLLLAGGILHFVELAPNPPELPPYEYQHVSRGVDVTCYGWDVNPEMIGASPKFWMCDNGYRWFDSTGVKSPIVELRKMND